MDVVRVVNIDVELLCR